jgi:hypothetical protein
MRPAQNGWMAEGAGPEAGESNVWSEVERAGVATN